MRNFFLGLMIFFTCVAGYYFFAPTEKRTDFVSVLAEKKEPVFEPNIVRRNVTPESVLPAPRINEGETLERLPAVIPPPPPPKPPKRPKPKVWANVTVVSAGIIKSGEQTLILKDINPIPLDKKCRVENGATWPCGMFARTEMRQFVRSRTIDCNPVKNEEASKIETRCQLANFDMSAWLVLTGWAEPKGDLFKDEYETAKAENRGQWRLTAP